jgi:hypothetical protein
METEGGQPHRTPAWHSRHRSVLGTVAGKLMMLIVMFGWFGCGALQEKLLE